MNIVLLSCIKCCLFHLGWINYAYFYTIKFRLMQMVRLNKKKNWIFSSSLSLSFPFVTQSSSWNRIHLYWLFWQTIATAQNKVLFITCAPKNDSVKWMVFAVLMVYVIPFQLLIRFVRVKFDTFSFIGFRNNFESK